MKIKSNSLVGIVMGSKSDWKTMIHCSETLKKFGVEHEVRVISAHRTPNRLHKFLKDAKQYTNKEIISTSATSRKGIQSFIKKLFNNIENLRTNNEKKIQKKWHP